MVYLLFFIFQICFPLFLLFLVLAFVTGAPFVPSTNAVARCMIEMAHLQKDQTVIDLGSGDGRLLALAQQAGACAIGLEMNPFLVLYSRLTGKRALWKNLWTADLSGADVVFIYLIPWRMDKLAAKLKRECKPHTLVISNSFIFPHWKILRKDAAHHVYVYRI